MQNFESLTNNVESPWRPRCDPPAPNAHNPYDAMEEEEAYDLSRWAGAASDSEDEDDDLYVTNDRHN